MNEAEKPKHTGRIHIDLQPYESPNPTNAETLYALAQVPQVARSSAKSGAHMRTILCR